MSNKVYDILKYIATLVLPALATLYTAIAGIWNLPYGEAVSATIMAIVTFLGVVLKISSNSYYKGLEKNNTENNTENKEE